MLMGGGIANGTYADYGVVEFSGSGASVDLYELAALWNSTAMHVLPLSDGVPALDAACKMSGEFTSFARSVVSTCLLR